MITTFHKVDPRALQARFDAEGDALAFAALRARLRAARPQGEPGLFVGTALLIGCFAIATLAIAAIG